MMHHRRAASDTAMFNRPLATDLKKEGTSSSHSSRSTTPLISLLARPTGKSRYIMINLESSMKTWNVHMYML